MIIQSIKYLSVKCMLLTHGLIQSSVNVEVLTTLHVIEIILQFLKPWRENFRVTLGSLTSDATMARLS